MRHARSPLMSWAIVVVALVAVAVAPVHAQTPQTEDAEHAAEALSTKPAPPPTHWLDRMPEDDRALLDALIGYAPPEQAQQLKWIGSKPLSWDELRGRVVVIQSWTSRSAAGRTIPDRLHEIHGEINSDDVQMIALHTPEGAETAETYLERRAAPVPVVLDANGQFCDELGFYRRPTNIVVDRSGAVRYAGLRFAALDEAVGQLLGEEWDPEARPSSRPRSQYEGSAEFPAFTNAIRSATDIRGKKAPDFHVQQWINGQPDARNKVVVVDFWATWCGPCVASIPHMNKLADAFRDDVVCVGISSEDAGKFASGMRKLASRKITIDSFHYNIALDPKRTMQSAVQIRGIPHVLVMSSDWIVRWQGHPTQLTKATLGQIVAANNAALGRGEPNRYRWTNNAD